MKFQTVVLLGMMAALVGCATPYDLRRSEPVVSFDSTKSAKEVKDCILKSWRSHISPVLEEKLSDGWLVRHNDTLPGATIAIVMIQEQASGVHVNYFHRIKKIHLYRLEEEVKACQ